MNTLLSLLDSILGPHKVYNKGEHYYACPFCHHHNHKFAVNLEKKVWKCWHCNQRGRTLISLLRKLECSREQITALREFLKDDISTYKETDSHEIYLNLPYEYRPMYKPIRTFAYNQALKYLLDRKITAFDMMKYNIGFCSSGTYSGRIIIPSYTEEGKLNFFTGRSFDGDEFMRYKNPPVSKNIIGFDSLIEWNYPVVLVEGVFDAISVKRNAIPMFGKTIPNKLKEKLLIKRPPHVHVLLDSDAMRNSAYIVEQLMNEGLNVSCVEVPSDADAGELGFLKVQELIKQTKQETFSTLIERKLSLSRV